VLEPLGFAPAPYNDRPSLFPPAVDPRTPEGALARAKLLRALVELGAWLAWYRRTNGARPPSVRARFARSRVASPPRGAPAQGRRHGQHR
jgi:hypothetical protein